METTIHFTEEELNSFSVKTPIFDEEMGEWYEMILFMEKQKRELKDFYETMFEYPYNIAV